MNDQYLDLIQAEIDGMNSEADSRRIRGLMASDAELQTAFDELQAVKLAIASMGELEPPPTLKRAIMDAIPFHAPATTRPIEAPWWQGIADLVRLPRPISLAYAFSLGLILAFVVSAVIRPVSEVSGLFSGTIVSGDVAGSEVVGEYDLVSVDGRIRVIRGEEAVVVELSWQADQPVQARIEFDSDRLPLLGTRVIEHQANFSLIATAAGVEVAGSGPLRHILTLGAGSGGPLSIDVSANGTTILREIVDPAGGQ